MSIESAKVISLVQPERIKSNQTQSINKSKIILGQFNNVEIEYNGVPYQAKVSFSCLVQPEINDIVLLAGEPEEGFYILSILERPQSNDMQLNFPGDTFLNSGTKLTMSSENLSFISKKTLLKSDSAFLNFNEVAATGNDVNLSFKTIKLFSNVMSTIAKHSVQKFKTLVRHTEESEQVKAGQLTCDVKGMYTLDSNYSILVSKKDTKIDGERIHMG